MEKLCLVSITRLFPDITLTMETEGSGRQEKSIEGNTRQWKAKEGNGRQRRALEGNRGGRMDLLSDDAIDFQSNCPFGLRAEPLSACWHLFHCFECI